MLIANSHSFACSVWQAFDDGWSSKVKITGYQHRSTSHLILIFAEQKLMVPFWLLPLKSSSLPVFFMLTLAFYYIHRPSIFFNFSGFLDLSFHIWPLSTLSSTLSFHLIFLIDPLPSLLSSPIIPFSPPQQSVRPTQFIQAPAELLGHDIAHPAAATADAGTASGAGAAGAAATTGLPVHTNYTGPNACHQCQCPGQFTTCCTGPNGGAKGKKAWFKFLMVGSNKEWGGVYY